MVDATDFKLRFLRFFCISKSIKSSPIYEPKSSKSAIFRYAREGEQKEAHSCTKRVHTDATDFGSGLDRFQGSGPVGSAEFLYYRNVPNEFAVACLFRRGRGDEFLKAGIIPERVEHWIEPEQRRSKREVRSQWARVRYRK